MPEDDPIVDEGSDSETVTEVARREHRYAKIGLIVGGIVATAGGVMIKVGLGGTVDLTMHLGGSATHLNPAVVGVVIVVIGGAIVIFTRRIIGKDGKKDTGLSP